MLDEVMQECSLLRGERETEPVSPMLVYIKTWNCEERTEGKVQANRPDHKIFIKDTFEYVINFEAIITFEDFSCKLKDLSRLSLNQKTRQNVISPTIIDLICLNILLRRTTTIT